MQHRKCSYLKITGYKSKVMIRQSGGRNTPTLRSVPEDRIAPSSPLSSRRQSDDTLLNGLDFPRVDSSDTLVEHKNMAERDQAATVERRRSTGIGGAGNMREDGRFQPS